MDYNVNLSFDNSKFYEPKVKKKHQLTKTVYAFDLEIPKDFKNQFQYESGQYVPIKYEYLGKVHVNEYSMTSAPYENNFSLGIKINSEKSSTNFFKSLKIGDTLMVGTPKGRFTLSSKPDEFRTILGFAGGIGITPILSHFKTILHHENRTRLYLFYGNKTKQGTAYSQELNELVQKYGERLQVFYFYSREKTEDYLLNGRIDDKKLKLIINQVLHTDDTDDESTIWDAVDEVLICGKGTMIQTLARACYEQGIPKRNIHFELFQAFNEDIFPQEKEFPLIENIDVEFTISDKTYKVHLNNNKAKLLQQLLSQGYQEPYSCKSGICGICECKLEEGEVELLENEYLTEKEEKNGHILACMSVVISEKVKINFDLS